MTKKPMFGMSNDYENIPENIYKAKEGNRLRFWQKDGETHRIIFLTDGFYGLYEHPQYSLNKSMEMTVCLKYNNLADFCPMCEDERTVNCRFTGYYPIIDCGKVTEWRDGEPVIEPIFTTKKGVDVQFRQQLLGAQRGSEKKNGLLLILQGKRKKLKSGSLKFTMWDISRNGEQDISTGSELDFVKQFDSMDEIKEYLDSLGCPADFDYTPIDFNEDYVVVKTAEEMSNILRGAGSSRTVTKGSGNGGKGSGGNKFGEQQATYEDDDIPF